MAENPRVQQLLDEILDSERTPEEVCGSCPELLPEVRRRWQEMCCVEAELKALFPSTDVVAGAGATAGSPPSTNLPLIPGYEVEAVLGHGGMGVVYRARQIKANRLVALKMIRAVEHASPIERLRFQIETEAVARLQHLHIVQLYEAGEVRGQPFFSLEFCDGGTLTEQLRKEPPTPNEAAALIETLARAMHYAHLRGVVHRDLKPGNVLLAGAEKVPKISDFGLAKRIDAEARDVSRSGAVMGTASYMAPEQAAGKVRDTGPAADVYALGALLYECLTGRPPFAGQQHVVLASVLNDEPAPPSRLAPKLPRDLETICLKCLNKEPARRYASAEELANDLRRFLAGEPVRARLVGAVERAAKWARRRPALAGLLSVTLLALAALTVLTGSLVVARSDAENRRKDAEKQTGIAQDEERKARQEADKAKKARDFLVSIFELSDARTQTGTLTPRQILDDAEKRISKDFAGQPELQAELQTAIDRVYAKITQNAPLAMILEVRGKVQLQSMRDARQRPVSQALLYAGDRLSLTDNAQVRLVVLSDLHQERLRPGSKATVRRKGCEPAEAVSARSKDVLMTFVRLPKGTFYMGWNGMPGSAKETEIKEDFEVAVHDVTQGQWQAVMGENPSYFSRFGGGRLAVKDISDEELKLFPVEEVSWNDAQEFLKKLNEKMQGRGYLYRLPSDAEWEYACRNGATSEKECSYHFYFDNPTNEVSTEQANFTGGDRSGKVPKGKNLQRTSRVGAYPPNKLGLCDMHGNVWQWTGNAEGWSRGSRGGCWFEGASFGRAAVRSGSAPAYRYHNRGFRLARVPVR
jgi:formylglycine-generating enzyme required for sulfatase activity/tRNA A-37 threonylcarbamoyl transferase component Bud32